MQVGWTNPKWNTSGRKKLTGKQAVWPNMSEVTRKQTSLIYRARTRMLKCKGNYKNGYPDQKCRMCKQENETQTHILEECPAIHLNENTKIPKPQLFTEDTCTLRTIASKIDQIMIKIEESVYWLQSAAKVKVLSTKTFATRWPGCVHGREREAPAALA